MSSQKTINFSFIYESDSGGETIATEELITHLNRQIPTKIQTLILPSLKSSDMKTFFLWWFNNVCASFGFAMQQQKGSIICVTTYPAGIGVSLAKTVKHLSLNFLYHGNRVPDSPSFQKQGVHFLTQFFKYYLSYYCHKLIILTASFIVFPSQHTRNSFLHQFKKAPGQKYVVLSPGVNLKVFKPASLIQKQKLKLFFKIPQNAFVIASVGRLDLIKRHLLVLQIFNELLKKYPKLFLVYAFPQIKSDQEKELFSNLNEFAEKNQLSTKILFLINQPVSEVYKISDLVISLSEQETFSLVMLETFSSGALFASTHPATHELLDKIDKKLCLVEKNEQNVRHQISELIQLEPTEKRKLIQKGQTLTKQHSWENVSKQFLDLILTYNFHD